MNEATLQPRYSTSHALVIGIDVYAVAPPLGYAVNDARAVAEVLKDRYSFQPEHIHVLLDATATRDSILKLFLRFSGQGTEINDRVLVFFAGHGHTVRSRRGEVGFLVPHDGDFQDLSTLLRWDQLTRGADLLQAKHVLFFMDACYGGLAITRALQAGSMRFLKDMMLRPARQVLTAGKANEVVADSGGPIPDHSVFTGHLLEGLGGKAADSQGVVTANGVMAYVYQMVSRDPNSRQTPHFGYLDGDGDFVFHAPKVGDQSDDNQGEDTLVSVPSVQIPDAENPQGSVVEQTKQLLGDDRDRIGLYELVARETRHMMAMTSEDYFPVSIGWSGEELAVRLQKYEEVTKTIREVETLIGHWGSSAHRASLTLALRRMSDRLGPQGGTSRWIALRWYPVLLLLYSGGIGAVAAGNYENVRALLQVPLGRVGEEGAGRSILQSTWAELGEVSSDFEGLPGHERNFVPLNEYLFKLLQPAADDLLFLGTEYETHFDAFEVLMSCEHRDQTSKERPDSMWGPIGRFGYKYRYGGNLSPVHRMLSEANALGTSWGPIRAGLFGGSIERFKEIVASHAHLSTTGW